MKKNIFGTDGIRGPVGIAPLDRDSIIKLGMVIGTWACNNYKQESKNVSILLGHDTRESCSFVSAALQAGILLHPVTVHDAHIIPTPALSQQISVSRKYDVGIIISASHNPYLDNGIKIVTRQGKLSLDDELAISQLFFDGHNDTYNYASLGITVPYHQLHDDYLATLANHFAPQFLSGIKIVLDYANGATYKIAQQLFHNFGATLISINDTPNGKNINDQCGALYLASLQHAVLANTADVGFAFDGDGDRVIAVNKHGQIKDGDDLLAILMQHHAYAAQTKIVGTLMTNQGFHAHVNAHGKQLARVNVGDKYIAHMLEKENLLIGGEQSGHIILRDYLNTGDGIFTALRTLEVLIATNNWDMHTFEKFPQILINTPIRIKKDLTTPFFAQMIAQHEAQLNGGRLLVRYSGTESLVRVMIEDLNLVTAQTVGAHLSAQLAKQLS